jgi:zinc/manganese transport system substrate-binding protein
MRTIATLTGSLLVLGAAGCSNGTSGPTNNAPIVVTTNVLGDVVRSLVGTDVPVHVLMAPDVDPHDFAPSTQDAEALTTAAVVVTSGLGFEQGMQDTLDAAQSAGANVFSVGERVDPRPVPDGEEGAGEPDPHWFTDPLRMARAVELLATELAGRVPALDTSVFRDRAAAYAQQLRALDASILFTLSAVPQERRKLVTNHDSLRYFAARYQLTFVGAVIPSVTTGAEPNVRDLEALAQQIRDAGVRAIFADSSSPTKLAEALRDLVGSDVEVVTLFTESLGPPGSGAETYRGMMQHNADVIAEKLR